MNDRGRPPEGVLEIDAATLRARRDECVDLLADAIAGGASVGFVLPVDRAALARFWDGIAADIEAGERIVLVMERDGRIAGSVQLAPCLKDNGRHRADLQKLLVLRDARGRGVARALMAAAETRALRAGLWLLLLDTREGSVAESLYRHGGWVEIGYVPDYARDPDRTLAGCVFFYKRLDGTAS